MAKGALAGMQGCTARAPLFFENDHTAPSNFRQFIDNTPNQRLTDFAHVQIANKAVQPFFQTSNTPFAM